MSEHRGGGGGGETRRACDARDLYRTAALPLQLQKARQPTSLQALVQ